MANRRSNTSRRMRIAPEYAEWLVTRYSLLELSYPRSGRYGKRPSMSEVIAAVVARRVWDSRGRPTLEVEIHSASGHGGRAMAPAGASTGSGEAFDRRDGGL